ncbi:MAG: SDR family oxidoreductase [Planctomycetota bacterium]|jgi:NADP-dependent 3-hydroxy acid dehydrogenase YdfG
MSALSDKVAVITGASSGIGEATAVALAGAGARLVLAARREKRIAQLARRIVREGGHAVAVPCDVADRGQVARVFETARQDFGRVDVLVNNAGVMPLAPMAMCRMDDWDQTLDINVKGLLYCIGHALPVMLEQKTGHIVNVSSVAGRRTFPAAAVYCGSKFAVHAISDGLRNELAEMGREDGNSIRVTIIAPGVVATELADSIRDDATREQSKAFYGSLPGPLQSEDIARAILFSLEAPSHVGVNEILVRPTSQAP